MKSFNNLQVKITDGFFNGRMQINGKVTVKAVYEQFAKSGRFEALKCIRNDENPSHIFWDSDVAKWLESAAILLSRENDGQIRGWYDEAIDDIVANQLECGYFNSYFQVYEPQNIFTKHWDHELYCAGHFFEAAIAAHVYLGDDRLLDFSKKYADYIYERFLVKRDTGFLSPGHEEIELALVKLYEVTDEPRYLQLAKHFIDIRGRERDKLEGGQFPAYMQSHLPVRQQREAEGHAVRALYLYCAMADLARIDNDAELTNAVQSLYDDIVNKKSYLTGGTGSMHAGEKFFTPYHLPNFLAYSETCSAIALALFCDRLIKLNGSACFADTFERVLYNAILSGVSLDGKSFFYVNPLEMHLNEIKYNQTTGGFMQPMPIAKRLEVFGCSCCPPNVTRFFEHLPSFIWYEDEQENCLLLSQYVTSQLDCDKAKISLESDLPYSGRIKLTVNSFGKQLKLKLRLPAWSSFTADNVENGWIIFDKVFDNEVIAFDLCPKLTRVYANPQVYENAAKNAFCFGPVVLCAEGTDNKFNLFATKAVGEGQIVADKGSPYALKARFDALTLAGDELYSTLPPKAKRVTLNLIPYFAWANREENDMCVWFLQ